MQKENGVASLFSNSKECGPIISYQNDSNLFIHAKVWGVFVVFECQAK